MKYTGCLSPGASTIAPGYPHHFNKKTSHFYPGDFDAL
jgi:hypothetical protein